jgi:hypothetical protein
LQAVVPAILQRAEPSLIDEDRVKIQLTTLNSREETLGYLELTNVSAIIDYIDNIEVAWLIADY